MSSLVKALSLLLVCTASLSAQSVIISEIMYNPDSSEASPNVTEWLEIYNSGPTTVDISGWFFQDEDGATSAFPAGTMIMAGQAIVFFPDALALADFQAAWGATFTAIPLGGWVNGSSTGVFGGTINGLSNDPSATNEVLTLVDATGAVVDNANYDDTAPWPTDSPDGPSIYVLPQFLNAAANDNGANWARSTPGTDLAFNNVTTAFFGGIDSGSPGVVAASAVAPFGITFAHVAPTSSIDINIVGGTPFALYQILFTFTNTGVAPNGPLFGIAPTLFELPPLIGQPIWFGALDGTGAFFLSFPGVPAPLGLPIDYVALELDAATNIVAVTPAIAGSI